VAARERRLSKSSINGLEGAVCHLHQSLPRQPKPRPVLLLLLRRCRRLQNSSRRNQRSRRRKSSLLGSSAKTMFEWQCRGTPRSWLGRRPSLRHRRGNWPKPTTFSLLRSKCSRGLKPAAPPLLLVETRAKARDYILVSYRIRSWQCVPSRC